MFSLLGFTNGQHIEGGLNPQGRKLVMKASLCKAHTSYKIKKYKSGDFVYS